MKKKKVINIMNGSKRNGRYEELKGDSLTLQNDTLSIADMLGRLAAGMPLTSYNGEYSDIEDEDYADYDWGKIQDMDMVDKMNLRNEAEEVINIAKNSKKKVEQKEIFEAKKEPEKEKEPTEEK